MKNEKHNNLIWIVFSMAIVFTLVVVIDNPVYAAYRAQHKDVPVPAVMMLAASEGITPFVAQPEAGTLTLQKTAAVSAAGQTDAAENDPQTAASVTKSAQPVKLASSIGGPGVPASEQPLPASAGADQNAAAQDAAYQNSGGPGVVDNNTSMQGTAALSAQDTAAEPQFITADMSYFDDACFIGDSFTQGLSIYSKNPNADYYYSVGVSTGNIGSKDFTLPGGGEGKLMDALAKKQYKKVYLMFGINEMAGDPAGYAQRYAGILQQIKTIQPNATIFIQSVLHTTTEKSAATSFKNEYINAFNEAVKPLADNQTVYYIDINQLFDDETGAMKAELSGDGVHLKAQNYIIWRDLLLRTVPAHLAPAPAVETQAQAALSSYSSISNTGLL